MALEIVYSSIASDRKLDKPDKAGNTTSSKEKKVFKGLLDNESESRTDDGKPVHGRDVYVHSGSAGLHVYASVSGKTAGDAVAAFTASSDQTDKSENESSAMNSAAAFNSAASENVLQMSAEERALLVSQLKDDEEKQQREFMTMVRKSLGYQASDFVNANATPSMDDNGIWHFLASGNYTVDLATREKAQENISEDGYYGVRKTADRIFTFAAALAGDDETRMRQMQNAIADGYRQAGRAWGQELPAICKDTLDTVNKRFEEYYDSKAQDSQDIEGQTSQNA